MTRRLSLLLALAALVAAAPARAEIPPPAPGALLTDAAERPVAPGLRYAAFHSVRQGRRTRWGRAIAT
jgi:hypothetical protein